VYLATYIARIDNVRAVSEQEQEQEQEQQQEPQDPSVTIISQELHDRLDTAIPIIDMNDIYAFIVDNQSMSRANWMPCREYQPGRTEISCTIHIEVLKSRTCRDIAHTLHSLTQSLPTKL
jgi:hypothetical protein